MKSTVQTRLRAYIKANGISQRFISKSIGLDEKSLSSILNNRRELRADEFMDICKAIRVNPNEFVEQIKEE